MATHKSWIGKPISWRHYEPVERGEVSFEIQQRTGVIQRIVDGLPIVRLGDGSEVVGPEHPLEVT